MKNKIIGARYAKALEKFCKNQSISLNDAYKQLNDVCLVLQNNKSLFELLKVSIYPLENKLSLLKSICNGYIYNLLSYMVINGRIAFIFDVLESFKQIMLENQNKAIAKVISAIELTENEKQSLSKAFSKILNKILDFEYFVDRELLGGIIVEVDGKVYDGSIKTYLTNIANKLSTLSI